MGKTYLKVPFSEKDKAKKLGARWDSLTSAWYIPEGKNLQIFKRWLSLENLKSNSYQVRNLHVPGNVYAFVAPGIHGWIPGFLLARVKIGLTAKHPEERRQQIISNQPGHDVKILKIIKVSDMAAVETSLHRRFKHRRVKLEKSREWFDLYPWELQSLKYYMERYEDSKSLSPSFPVSKIFIGLILAFCLVSIIPTGMEFVQNLVEESSENSENFEWAS